MIYADSSFLFSLYAWDDNTEDASEIFAHERRRPLLFTPWQAFELRNAVRLAAGRLARAKQPVPFQVGNVLKVIREDIAAGRLKHAEPDWRKVLGLAEELSSKHTQSIGVASVDIWHVAAAILLRSEVFWTFDEDQRALAKQCGQFRHVQS